MKELIPEFYSLPEMFLNTNKFPLAAHKPEELSMMLAFHLGPKALLTNLSAFIVWLSNQIMSRKICIIGSTLFLVSSNAGQRLKRRTIFSTLYLMKALSPWTRLLTKLTEMLLKATSRTLGRHRANYLWKTHIRLATAPRNAGDL